MLRWSLGALRKKTPQICPGWCTPATPHSPCARYLPITSGLFCLMYYCIFLFNIQIYSYDQWLDTAHIPLWPFFLKTHCGSSLRYSIPLEMFTSLCPALRSVIRRSNLHVHDLPMLLYHWEHLCQRMWMVKGCRYRFYPSCLKYANGTACMLFDRISYRCLVSSWCDNFTVHVLFCTAILTHVMQSAY